MILQYTSFDRSTGASATTYMNIGREAALSLGADISGKINKDWNYNIGVFCRINKVTNTHDPTYSGGGLSGNNMKINSVYNISKRFTISGFAAFFQGQRNFQTIAGVNYYYGNSLRYKMLNNKLVLAFQAITLFQKFIPYRTAIKSRDFDITSINRTRAKSLLLNLSYNFGKLKENVSKKKGVTTDDQ